jgi:hypothetical protein
MLSKKLDIEADERETTIQNLVNEMNVAFGRIHDLVFILFKLYW